ncbi:MAG: molybdopterin converting factor subunit 1 [Planctomycetia bacterium]|nr:molybdopterin converting factor subunit 1 [Planctomycetia bacterium]
MTYRVKFFAAISDLAGTDVAEVELEGGATVADLRRALGKQFPLARSLLGRSGIAVNHELAENDRPLEPSDELAIIPPVSGG